MQVSPPLLDVSEIAYAYAGALAVRGVSLTVAPGEIVALLGANGAGKTTSVKMIAGVLRPRGGSIRFNGNELAGAPSHAVVRHGITLVPEGRLVFPQMTVLENLQLGGHIRRDGTTAAQLDRMFTTFPRLAERRRQLAGSMSGGEQQMLAIARGDQRIARSGFGIAEAAATDTRLVLRDWRLERTEEGGRSRYVAVAASDSGGFAFQLTLDATQPLLLQGVGGVSQKGPLATQTSRYYSEPQLATRGSLALDGKAQQVSGRAWLDHEWSDAFLDPIAVGWDWIGINLDDGGALTAFRLRRADGSALWAGGSVRPVGGQVRNFGPGEVVFTPGRTWRSPASQATYPVEWRIATPAGAFTLAALQDDQELDSRASTGAIYWEGLSLLADASGRRVGRGYLEMTGYVSRLVL